jgi:hypothetical protein
MNSCAAIILFLLLFIGSLVHAQSPCADCFTAVEDALKACLDSAISVDDQTVCGDRRSEQLRVCGKGDECRTERAKPEQKTDAPPPQKRLSVEERLQQLKRLKEQGLITEEDYIAKKNQLLEGL